MDLSGNQLEDPSLAITFTGRTSKHEFADRLEFATIKAMLSERIRFRNNVFYYAADGGNRQVPLDYCSLPVGGGFPRDTSDKNSVRYLVVGFVFVTSDGCDYSTGDDHNDLGKHRFLVVSRYSSYFALGKYENRLRPLFVSKNEVFFFKEFRDDTFRRNERPTAWSRNVDEACDRVANMPRSAGPTIEKTPIPSTAQIKPRSNCHQGPFSPVNSQTRGPEAEKDAEGPTNNTEQPMDVAKSEKGELVAAVFDQEEVSPIMTAARRDTNTTNTAAMNDPEVFDLTGIDSPAPSPSRMVKTEELGSHASARQEQLPNASRKRRRFEGTRGSAQNIEAIEKKLEEFAEAEEKRSMEMRDMFNDAATPQALQTIQDMFEHTIGSDDVRAKVVFGQALQQVTSAIRAAEKERVGMLKGILELLSELKEAE